MHSDNAFFLAESEKRLREHSLTARHAFIFVSVPATQENKKINNIWGIKFWSVYMKNRCPYISAFLSLYFLDTVALADTYVNFAEAEKAFFFII